MKFLLIYLLLLTQLFSSEIEYKRVALLFANANYDDSEILHIENDLFDLEIFLKQKNFKVISVEDATKREMVKALRQFSQALEDSEVALFYFGGESVALNSKNYIVPYESSIIDAEKIPKEGLELSKVYEIMRASTTRNNILLLDMNILEYIKFGDDSYKKELHKLNNLEHFEYYIDFSTSNSRIVEDFIKYEIQKNTKGSIYQPFKSRYSIHVDKNNNFIF